MFYLFIHALIITKISVLVRVGIRWILGGVREELVGDWGSYSGDIVYFVLFKEFKFQLGLLSLNNMIMHITANCNESHIKLLET